MASSPSPRLPHSLRFVIFCLRVAIGLDLFYLAWSAIFNPALATQLTTHPMGNLYAWLTASANAGWFQIFSEWAILLIGALLIFGLATRVASLGAFILILVQYLQTIVYNTLALSRFINDEVVILLCLLILVVAHAGTYLGFDRFIHGAHRHQD